MRNQTKIQRINAVDINVKKGIHLQLQIINLFLNILKLFCYKYYLMLYFYEEVT